jgi:hypothetical protein
MTFGLSAAAVGLIGAGAAVAGSAISANAAQNAADTQLQGTQDATAAQERMLERQIGLQEPWRQAGISGLNALLQYTGLSQPGQSVGGAAAPAAGPTARSTMMGVPAAGTDAAGQPMTLQQYAASKGLGSIPLLEGVNLGGGGSYAPWLAGYPGAGAAAPGAPAGGTATAPAPSIPPGQVGSLLKPFSMADYQADPGYQFRVSQGEQGLTRAAMATHSLNSGKYIKDALRFNSDMGSQEYGAAYGRYNTDQTNTFNRLASIAGLGQQATNQQTAAVGTAGAQIGSNILGGANALAAGQVGGANAINSGIGQGVSMYQTNRMLDLYGANRGVSPPNPFYGQTTVPAYAPGRPGDWYDNTSSYA